MPFSRPAFTAHFQANNGVQGAKRGVIARRPLWVDKRKWPGFHWNIQFGMKQPASHIRCIHVEGNRWRGCSRGRSRGSGKQRHEKCEGATENVRYFASELHIAVPTHFGLERSSRCNLTILFPSILKRCVRCWRGVCHLPRSFASRLSSSLWSIQSTAFSGIAYSHGFNGTCPGGKFVVSKQ
jgi:hypothetical protein